MPLWRAGIPRLRKARMSLTSAERAALEAAITALRAAAGTCDEDSPVGAMMAARAKRWGSLLDGTNA